MKVTIQRPTAAGVRFITLPDVILELMGWKEGEEILIEPVVPRDEETPSYIVLEKR